MCSDPYRGSRRWNFGLLTEPCSDNWCSAAFEDYFDALLFICWNKFQLRLGGGALLYPFTGVYGSHFCKKTLCGEIPGPVWRKSRPRVAKFRALCGEIPAKDVEKSVPIMPQSSTKFGKKSRPQIHKTRLKNKARKIATRGLDPYCAGKKTPISLRKRHGQNKALRLAQKIGLKVGLKV